MTLLNGVPFITIINPVTFILPFILYRNSDKDHIIDVMNVKLDSELITSIKNTKGFAEAFHMNKTHWVSIEIGNVSDTKIKTLIDMSFNNIS